VHEGYIPPRVFRLEAEELNDIVDRLHERFQEVTGCKIVKLRTPLTDGLSGAIIHRVEIHGTDYDGYGYAKVDHTRRSQREFTNHSAVKQQPIGEYMPDLLNGKMILEEKSAEYRYEDGDFKSYSVNVYKQAQDNPDAELLANLIGDVSIPLGEPVGHITRFVVQVIGAWHPEFGKHWKTLQVPVLKDDPHNRESLFSRMLNLGGDDRISDLAERASTYFGLEANHDYMCFQSSPMLPNPFAFIFKPELWDGKADLGVPLGPIHGDCNAKNIMCIRPASETTPSLIDFAQYDDENSAFFDVAYLEVDLLLRRHPELGSNWRTWLTFMETLSKDVKTNDEPNSPNELMLFRTVMPLRTFVQAQLESVQRNPKTRSKVRDFKVAWWLSCVAAGLLFARRLNTRPEQRMAALLYAGYCMKSALKARGVALPDERSVDLFRLSLDVSDKKVGQPSSPLYAINPSATSTAPPKPVAPSLVQISDTLQAVERQPANALDLLQNILPQSKWCLVPQKENVTIGDDSLPDSPLKQTSIGQPYRMLETLVTQSYYQRFLQAEVNFPVPLGQQKPYQWDSERRLYPDGKADHPVVGVNLKDAWLFCNWLQTQCQSIDPLIRVELPSEVEWEYAARGDNSSRYPWGNNAPKHNICNYGGYYNGTTPVYEFVNSISQFGCLDMCGNVWEWTRSLYRPNSDKATDVLDLQKLGLFDRTVVRGGSWDNISDERTLYSAYRHREFPHVRSDMIGFRVTVRRAN